MGDAEGFDVRERARSFAHAARGVAVLLSEQHNSWIHLAATIVVVAAGAFFGVSRLEWCALVLAIASVWGAEALNTAVEHLADAAVPGHHPLVGKAKDVAAGAVLVCAGGATIVAAIVFGPHVAAWLGG